MLTYFFTYLEIGDIVLYSVSKIMILLQKCVKLCHIRYGKGQKGKLEQTTVKVLHCALVNQEGSH